jgi:hypothetical protein
MAETPTQRIVKLEGLGLTIDLRLTSAEKAITAVESKQAADRKEVDGKCTGYEKQLQLLEHKVEELRKAKESSSGKIWALVMAFIGAVIGAGVTLAFKKLFP